MLFGSKSGWPFTPLISGEMGFDLFDGFSQKSDHYDREELEAKFEYTFDAAREDSRKRTVRTVYMWAKGESWNSQSGEIG